MIAYKAILLLGDVYVDMSREELSTFIHQKEDNIYKALWKKASNRLHVAERWTDSFNPTDIADEVFFIAPNGIENFKQIRSDYGCLVVAEDNDIFYLERLCRNNGFSLIPVQARKQLNSFETSFCNNWGDVFKQVKEIPINAAIISDNFLFGDKYNDRKEYSLFNLLRNLVPSSLKTSFHLTMFVCNDKGLFREDKARVIVNEIKRLNLCSDLKVTIIAHTMKSLSHDRKILTNYHYITSGCGFNIISADGPAELSEGDVSCVFKSLDSLNIQTSIKHKYDYSQAWYKDIIDNHLKDNYNCFMIGDNINRLLKD